MSTANDNRLFFNKEEINGHGDCPTYLYRWTLVRVGDFAIYLHHFVGDDWSLDYHDHPKRFISIGLKGGYIEQRPQGPSAAFEAPWIRSFPAEHQHRIVMEKKPADCWTLCIVGQKTREWGFWYHGVDFYPWRDYVDIFGAKRRACP